mmetsp:Transcript_5095/g.7554  ORF Transcript_5095/g.7554 Transcript_5095/m.7554 type:complete len:470 (-) Transcript_5095:295-1704(-)
MKIAPENNCDQKRGIIIQSSPSVLTSSLSSDDNFDLSTVEGDFHFPLKAFRTTRHISRSITECEFNDVTYLGSGSNSFVYTAVKNGEFMVVKMLKKNLKHGEIAEQELNLEMHLLTKITHPNIIAIKGAGKNPRSFIAVEHLAGGTLDQMLEGDAGSSQIKKSVNKIALKACLSISKQLVSALKYLHEDLHPLATVIHRDLKPQNIGFDADRNLKLFDFGLAACVRKKVFANETYKMTGFTGTLAYMAPEVALRKPYNEKVDVYSFGIILWQMVTGETPFDGMGKAAYIERVVMGGLRPSIPRDVPKDLATLMQQCWDADPKRRPSCTAILASLEEQSKSMSSRTSFLSSLIPKMFSRSSHSSSGRSRSSSKIASTDNSQSDEQTSPLKSIIAGKQTSDETSEVADVSDNNTVNTNGTTNTANPAVKEQAQHINNTSTTATKRILRRNSTMGMQQKQQQRQYSMSNKAT